MAVLAFELVPTAVAIGRCTAHPGVPMTDQPHRESDTPFAVNVERGKDYWWCACGQSKNQPLCDGSHKKPF